MLKKVNIYQKYSLFSETWTPKVIAQMNEIQFKIIRANDEFVWHKHDHTDEAFIVIEGEFSIALEDNIVELSQGEICVIPKGLHHKPFARNECKVMIIEPCNVINTGTPGKELTAENDVWI